MRVSLGIAARLCGVALTLAASLPGHLQLVHQHAGGERVHVHADAEALAAHDLAVEHEHAAHHSHPHSHPGARSRHAHAAQTHDGPELWAVAALHVHGLNPFQQATRTMVSADTGWRSVASTVVAAPRTPPSRPRPAARPRGPPTFLVG